MLYLVFFTQKIFFLFQKELAQRSSKRKAIIIAVKGVLKGDYIRYETERILFITLICSVLEYGLDPLSVSLFQLEQLDSLQLDYRSYSLVCLSFRGLKLRVR